jgi:predicted acylesterase/phospholipase RssA
MQEFKDTYDGRKLFGVSIGGGGCHGIGPITVLANIAQMRSLKSEISAYSGVSVGAILGAALSVGYDPAVLYQLMKTECPKFFKKYPLRKRLFNRTLPKYDDSYLNDFLKKFFGDTALLSDLDKPTYLLAFRRQYGKNACKVFDNGDEIPIWKAVRASMAAQSYFDPFEINGVTYTDGGFVCNSGAGILKQGLKRITGDDRKIAILDFDTSGNNNRNMMRKRKTLLGWGKDALTFMLSGSSDMVAQQCAEDLGNRFYSVTVEGRVTDIPMDEVKKMREIEKVWAKRYERNFRPLMHFIDGMTAWKR